MNNFKAFWKLNNTDETLTKSEIVDIQQKIALLQKRGLPSSKIISALQKYNSKLTEKWKAERVYWTEVKARDTQMVAEAGEELGISKYKIILSPSACKTCREKSQNGRKIFKSSDVEKSGYGHVPPFHPNCYCVLIPFE